jgi:O-antigen ligase
MARLLQSFEKIFAIISLLLSSGALFTIFLGTPNPAPGIESPILRLLFVLIYLISFCITSLRWKKTLRTISKSKWLLCLLAIAVLSIFWSSVPDITSRRVIGLIGTTLFGVYLGSSYTFNEQLKLLGWTYGISIILSFTFVFLLPEYGVMQIPELSGNWRGIYTHKSSLGENMFISFITFYFLSKTIKRHQYLFWLACILSLGLIVFAKSSTSLGLAVLAYILFNTFKYISFRTKNNAFLIVLILLFLLFLTQAFAMYFESILVSNDKDITLTGRTPLWASIWDFIKLRFWFGYGYGAFFTNSHYETLVIWKIHIWKPPHAHNGYIQLFLNVGFVGLVTFTIGYFYTVIRVLISYLSFGSNKMLFIFLFLMCMMIFNITEVSFLAINNLSWIISLAFIYSLYPTSPLDLKSNV